MQQFFEGAGHIVLGFDMDFKEGSDVVLTLHLSISVI